MNRERFKREEEQWTHTYCYCDHVPLYATFFSQKWHPNFGLFGYNIIDGRHTDASTLPSSCLRRGFASGGETTAHQRTT